LARVGANGCERYDLVAALASHPALIARPIVIANGKAAQGRPAEAVPAIL
jgi:arsenate reductase